MSVSQHRRKNAPTVRQRWSTLAVTALGLLLAQPAAYAAGFGQLRVQSNLGQPLQAEIDISGVTAEEAAGLNVKLASPAAYASAGLTYLPAVSSLRLDIERRPNGSYVAKVRSSQPISEPFVDILIDMSWSSGKVSRAYTFLLDPAGAKPSNQTFSPATVVQAATPDASPAAAPAPVPLQEPAPAAAQSTQPAAQAQAQAARPARQPASRRSHAAQAVTGGESPASGAYTVKRGDTLSSIANDALLDQEGVSLDQMLVALYRNNPNAFIGGNINRLKSGTVLQVPSRQQAQSLTPKAARREVVARTQGFDAYRSRLAGAAAAKSVEADSGRQQSGNVTARVQDQAVPAAGPQNELKLSKGERAGQANATAQAEENVARDRQLKEAESRLAQLQKNVGDMQKLLELKNSEIAKLSQANQANQANQAAAADKGRAEKAAPAEAKAPTVVAAEPPKTDAPAQAAPATPTAQVDAASAAPAQAAAAATAAVATSPATPAASAPVAGASTAQAAAPAPKRPPVVVQAEPAPEPSFLDGLLANPMLLPGGGLLVALLGGYAIYRRRQQQKSADGGAFGDSILSQESTVMAGANSLFGAAGGQSVDTSQHSVFGADFRIGNNMPEASEVDPLAEAEVYIAYGRDVQAEEILREALEKDPEQQPIRLKLLEIYSNRQDVEGFRVIAEEMFAQTGGQGAEWLKAAEMGRALDAGNALYLAVSPDTSSGPETSTPASDQWRTQDPSHDPAVAPREPSLGDLALPLDAFPAPAAGDPIIAPESASLVFSDTAMRADAPLEPAAKFDGDLDLTLPVDGDDTLADVPRLDTPTRSRMMEFDMSGLSLDFNADAATESRDEADATTQLPSPTMIRDGKLPEPIDLAALGDTGPDTTPGVSPSTLSTDGMDGGRDMQIKLDLARAYIEIGDKEGARELLQEVVEQSQDDLQAEARSLLLEVV
ncbi:LysM peptidoglycan-binding domain-containing protein [Cupriavidus pinatubonensis]|uniref:FimV/HubP family polar landmark protein n=1 Tax=Cupriavidus pinatubonensis TaxID=248026 RepID=UPI001C72D56F|nr:FimV/HubP family polar landmark protein [Cupriavidus pinatubonensis]QYY30592.1 LysM peptidoglycan-binding domain-containing protein [Cupriavidus pinatubonensis]